MLELPPLTLRAAAGSNLLGARGPLAVLFVRVNRDVRQLARVVGRLAGAAASAAASINRVLAQNCTLVELNPRPPAARYTLHPPPPAVSAALKLSLWPQLLEDAACTPFSSMLRRHKFVEGMTGEWAGTASDLLPHPWWRSPGASLGVRSDQTWIAVH